LPRTVPSGATVQLHMKEHPMDVTRDIVLPLGRDEAWEVVSDPEAWLAERADLELVPGAEGTLDERRAIVEDVDPGERLSFWWGDRDQLLTRVELTLDDVRDGTRVTVVESGPAVGPVASAMHRMQLVPA
jgi:uncharacterized protein YndB with AHSA1/START domain